MFFLSVIIPVYNVENYLKECIDSILSQNFDDLEILLIDDGSQDGSSDICDSYRAKDQRIKVIHKKNGGQATARNLGISMAQGTYVVFLDSDDFWLSNTLEPIIRLLKEKDTDLLMFPIQSYYEGTGLKPFSTIYTNLNLNDPPKEVLKQILRQTPAFGWCPIWYFFKKTVLEKYFLVFPEGLLSEDVFFSLGLWCSACNFYYYEQPIYAYRRDNQKSTTHIAGFKFANDLLKVIQMCIDHFESYQIDEDLRQLLYLNYQDLICVVLFHYSKYSKFEKKELRKQIQSLKFVFHTSKNYCKYISLKAKIKRFTIKCFGVHITGLLWGIKRKLQIKC